MERKLFVKWALLNSLSLVFLGVLGILFGSKIHGPSVMAVPVILSIYGFAQYGAGRIAWNEQDRRLMHEARWLPFWAWIAQMVGILSTVYGFWRILTTSTTNEQLHANIQAGGGLALIGTFVGVYVSVILIATHRLIEHELES